MRVDVKELQYLVQHLTVLGCHAHAVFKRGRRFERFYQRGHLDAFWAGSKNSQEFHESMKKGH